MPALFEAEHTESVKAWLVSELAPICDAEPDVLADYVIALLKHEASKADLAALLNEQLLDFLDDKTDPFVSKLIEAISSKSYVSAQGLIGQQAAPPAEERTSRKRAAEDDRPVAGAKAPRTEGLAGVEDGTTIRKAAPTPRNGVRGTESGGDGSAQMGSSKLQSSHAQHSQRRQKCRDFHEKGWCSRGESCRFEHSLDAIRGGLPFAARFDDGLIQNNSMSGQSFGVTPAGGFQPGMPHFTGPASLSPPAWASASGSSQHFAAPPNHTDISGTDSQSLASRLGQHPQSFESLAPDAASTSSLSSSDTVARGTLSGRGRGRGRGGHGIFQNRTRSTTTLVIENVPPEHLDLVHINDYFRRFGVITNIQIDASSGKALVSYSSSGEAKAAHENPDVIFGNRFVKVYFQKLDVVSDPAQPPKPATNPVQVVQRPFTPGQNVYRAPGTGTHPQATSHTQAGDREDHAHKRRQAMQTQKQAQDELDRLMTEQKQLLLKIGSKAVSVDDRKAGMKKLKQLEPTIKEATDKVKQAVAVLAGMPGLPSGSRHVNPAQRQEKRDRAAREQLDRELEAHSKSSVPGTQNEELRAKLESLKAEAASMGIKSAQPEDGHPHRGPRPERSEWSGSRPMRLDNRSTRLSVSGLSATTDVAGVKQWLQNIGDVVKFEDAGSTGSDFTVTFKYRQSGEQAVRAANNVPNVGKVTLSWAPAITPTGGPSGKVAGDVPPLVASQNDVQASESGGLGDTKGKDDDWKR